MQKLLKIILSVSLLATCLLAFTACTDKSIDINEYITIEENEKKTGDITINFDDESFKAACLEKGMNEDEFAEMTYSYSDAKETESVVLEDEETGISKNFIRHTISWTVDDDAFSAFGIKLSHENMEYFAEYVAKADVPDPTPYKEDITAQSVIDPFVNVDVEIVGISPDAQANIIKDDSPYSKIVKFTLSQSKNIKNGDTITLTAESTKKEYKLKETQKEYQVSGLSEYITDIEEIPQDLFTEMQHKLARDIAAWWKNNETENTYLNEAVFKNSFLTVPKKTNINVSTGNLYMVYEMDAVIDGEPTIYYWCAHFNSLVIKTPDGTCSLNLDDYTEDNGNIENNGKLKLKGFTDYTTLFNKLIASKSGEYTYQERAIERESKEETSSTKTETTETTNAETSEEEFSENSSETEGNTSTEEIQAPTEEDK